MSLYDCPECWNVICSCGYEYQKYSNEDFVDFLYGIMSYHDREIIIKKLVQKLEDSNIKE